MRVKKLILLVAVVAVALMASGLMAGLFLQPMGPVGRVEETSLKEGVVVTRLLEAAKPPQLELAGRMVVYSAELSIESENPSMAAVKARGIAEGLGGFVSASQVTGSEAVVVVRVPQARFFEAIERLKGLGKVLSERVASEDVTEQFVDLQARLSNLKSTEARLLEMLGMAKSVEDVLKVEAELSRVRGEVERITGMLKYLERRVELATITVRIRKPEGPPELQWPKLDLARAIAMGLSGLYAVASALVVLAISAGPLAAIAIPAYYGFRRLRARPSASKAS